MEALLCSLKLTHSSSSSSSLSPFHPPNHSLRVTCNCHSYPEIDDSRIIRKLIKQGIEPTPKAVHHARKKEIQKVKRRARKEEERAAKATKQYTWSDVYRTKACEKLRMEETHEDGAAALLRLIHDNHSADTGSEIHTSPHTIQNRNVSNANQSLGVDYEHSNRDKEASKHVEIDYERLLISQVKELSSRALWQRFSMQKSGDKEDRVGDSKKTQESISANLGSEAGEREVDGLSMIVEDKKLQLLAQRLNRERRRISNWAFSQLMRSCRLRMTDDRVLRLVKILGEKGNWQHAMGVVSWLHSRQRHWKYQSRHVYTTMLSVLGNAHRQGEALRIFNKMQESISSYPDMAAYHCIAMILGQAGHLHRLLEIIEMLKNGSSESEKKPEITSLAAPMFPDIIVYNAVLNACVPHKEWRRALSTWNELNENGILPNNATYGLMMEVMVKSGKYNQVFLYYNWMQRAGFLPNAFTYKFLAEALGRNGRTDEAVRLVEQMEHSGTAGSSGVYYSLACALCMAGKWQAAILQVNKIRQLSSRKADVITYTGLIQACQQGGHLHDAVSLFNYAQLVSSPNTSMCNVMINIYGRNHMFQAAMGLYEAMKKGSLDGFSTYKSENRLIPDFFTYQAMMGACVLAKEWICLETVYKDMTMKGYYLVQDKHLWMISEVARAHKDSLIDHMLQQLSKTGEICDPRSNQKQLKCS